MIEIDITTQKNTLLRQHEQVVGELERIAIHHPETDDWEARFDTEVSLEADDSLMGDSIEAAEEQIATLALLETRYRNIQRALKKIDQGTYGVCELSGEPIEPARLVANPAARTCQAHMDDEVDLPL